MNARAIAAFGFVLALVLSSSPASMAVDVANLSELMVLRGHTNYVLTLDWNPNGTMLASGSRDKTVILWNGTSGEKFRTISGFQGAVNSVVWSPDGRQLAVGTDGRDILIVDPNTSAITRTLTGHTSGVTSLDWNQDGSRLVSGSYDHTIRIWDPQNGGCLQTLNGHTESVVSVGWSPCGMVIASASADQTARLWDANTGCQTLVLGGFPWPVYNVAWSPNGTQLATTTNGQVGVWNPQNGTLIQEVEHYHFLQAAWTPDGKYIASGLIDGRVIIYSLATGRIVTPELDAHSDWVNWVSWSPGSDRLATGSSDFTVKVWGKKSETGARVSIKGIEADRMEVTAGQNLTLVASLRNDGNLDARQVKVDFFDGNAWIGTAHLDVLMYSSNATSYVWTLPLTVAAGMHFIRARAGQSEANMSVTARGIARPWLKALNTSGAVIDIGESCLINVSLGNNGTDGATSQKVAIMCDGTAIMVKTIDIPLNGTSFIYRWTTPRTMEPGFHRIGASMGVDKLETTVELVGRPDIHLKSATTGKTTFPVAENITIWMVIANDGTANATGCLLRVVEGGAALESCAVNITRGREVNCNITIQRRLAPGIHELRIEAGTENATVLVKVVSGGKMGPSGFIAGFEAALVLAAILAAFFTGKGRGLRAGLTRRRG